MAWILWHRSWKWFVSLFSAGIPFYVEAWRHWRHSLVSKSTRMALSGNPLVFFDVKIGGEDGKRVFLRCRWLMLMKLVVKGTVEVAFILSSEIVWRDMCEDDCHVWVDSRNIENFLLHVMQLYNWSTVMDVRLVDLQWTHDSWINDSCCCSCFTFHIWFCNYTYLFVI